MTDNIKPETIKKTQDYLGKYIKKPPLTEKLLKKPPFRFLHDIITNVIKETGFLNGVFTPEELNHENIKDRDGKITFLQKTIDAVKAITGNSLTVRPSKIVAGHEPTKTNELLQAIGKAIDKKLDSNDYVASLGKTDKVEKEGKSKISSKEDERAKVKGRERSRSKARPTPVTAPKEKEVTSGSRSKRSKTKDPPSSRRVASETDVAPPETRGEDEAMVSASAPDVIPVPAESLPSAPVNVTPEETDPTVASETPEVTASGDAGTSGTPLEAEESPGHDAAATNATDVPHHSPEAPLADSPFPTMGSDSPAKKVSTHEKKRKQSKGAAEPVRAMRATPMQDKDDAVAVLAAKTSSGAAPATARAPLGGPRAPPSGVPPGARAVAAPPSARPRTARPASARPAAPRVRERGVVPVPDESSSRLQIGKVDVITDDSTKDQDEIENFVVVESPLVTALEEGSSASSPAMGGDGPRSVESVADGAQGHLVAQILETQRELEEKARQLEGQGGRQAHVDIEWGEGRRREREAAGREVERLRTSIQTLTRAANPLGKLMDFLQEDADAMQRELDTWRASNQQLSQQLAMEHRRTEEALEPLRLRLAELQRAVDGRRDEISALKANILRNDSRMRRLVHPTPTVPAAR